MGGKRNRYGVNDASDCYRTIDGRLYVAWTSFPSPERIAAYRKAGLRCRRFGEELFIYENDQKSAEEIDAELDPKP